jgi:hypothetical protein
VLSIIGNQQETTLELADTNCELIFMTMNVLFYKEIKKELFEFL